MKKTFTIILAILIIFNLTSCASKSSKKEFKSYSFDWFDTVTVITGYENTQEKFDKVIEEIDLIFEKYHKLYNIYTQYDGINNLTTINEKIGNSHNKVKVDSEIIDLLEYSKDLYSITDGTFNIAMGSVLSIWHTYREKGMSEPETAQLPPFDMLQEASKHTDINNIKIDKENSTVFLDDENLKLDVGAIAKGYACEEVAKYLENKGISGYCINAGGNIRTVGPKPNGEKWLVGIENPDKSNKETPYISYLELDHMALVTSGSYQSFYICKALRFS